MKTILPICWRTVAWLLVLIAWPVAAGTTQSVSRTTAVTPAPTPRVIKIESVEPAGRIEPEGDVTWLGVYAEEASEALSSQLGLNSGEGLVVTYVASDSPAVQAGVQKNDVLVELRDQLLVHPAQLVKLIRSQKDGTPVKLTFYRQGKRQTVTATLGKRPAVTAMWPALPVAESEWKPGTPSASVHDGIHGQMQILHKDLMSLDADKQKVRSEVERSMEEARKALQDALRNQAQTGTAIGLDPKDLEALNYGSVDIGDNATVIVKKSGRLIRTIVQTDDTGSYVLMAIPKKRLTAHDKDGKLLFDGEVETEEQQQKVPADLREKVKPMLQQLKPVEDGGSKPHAQTDYDPKS
jgi:membrane-associated protease RseP (regulator of RpoE activity)